MKWQRRAITPIEIIVVITIIGLLIGILVPAINRSNERISQMQKTSLVEGEFVYHKLSHKKYLLVRKIDNTSFNGTRSLMCELLIIGEDGKSQYINVLPTELYSEKEFNEMLKEEKIKQLATGE